ncbi:P-type DNA transfer ATPase VirB11 [Massilia sp. CCM 9210]|uniref:P-type DNA transfer ATPase VirB11 n=1 Tax=Massilia scottii TaxID=3057166 RepID=UPI0027967C11|nr:P-type DNA transfer ATPase VirB11 [Massilia sp. CCM 9210]MDQ1817826.1 P-type DNA transfer ATPase VirB11 [Massilia sp. CCM 9210]
MQKMGISDALSGEITEFAVNRPGEYWIENQAGWHCIEHPALTLSTLKGFGTASSVFCHKKLDSDSPIQSLTLPDGERAQIVYPPVCTDGTISLTIRKPSPDRFSVQQFADSGRLKPRLAGLGEDIQPWEADLLQCVKNGRMVEFFAGAAKHLLNIVTVGGTGSGKTTFSKAMIDLYPADRRIFTLEDAHELTTPRHKNAVHLFFSPTFNAKEVLASCMRMKPDHIFLAELRGDETWDYLMALKSGHQGSITSIHANDCRGALYKIASYIKQSEVGRTLDMSYILGEVQTTIDVVLYFEKTHLVEIYYDPHQKLKLLRGAR